MRSRRLTFGLTARAFAAVHSGIVALVLIALSGVASLVFAGDAIRSFGPFRLAAPVSVQLMVPAVSGTAAALACWNTARLPLPDPLQAKIARGLWCCGWVALAIVVSQAGHLSGGASPMASVPAIIRNVLLDATLALIVIVIRMPASAWVPPVTFTLVTLLYGSSGTHSDFSWWSVLLRTRATAIELAIAGSGFVAVLGAYLIAGAPRAGRDAAD